MFIVAVIIIYGYPTKRGCFTNEEAEKVYSLLRLTAEQALDKELQSELVRAYELRRVNKIADIAQSVLAEKSGLTSGELSANNFTVADLVNLVKEYDIFNQLWCKKVVNSPLTEWKERRRTIDFSVFSRSFRK